MAAKGRKRYQYRRLLDELASKRGRGTELISVYITPGFDLSQVVQQLREEQGTAENIKSKSTRKNVIAALDRIINFLRKYIDTHKKTPLNGMAVFSGNIAEEEGATDVALYWIEPPEPITVRMYRCDQEFVLDPLREAIEPKESIGLLALDTKDATVATLRGKHVDIARHLTSGVWGKHGRGGQSARRFERLREIAVHEFMKRIAEVANREFLGIPDLKAILVGGPGPTKDEFVKSGLLRDEIRKKISAVLDTGYTDEQGIKELVNKSSEILADLDVMREKSIVQHFMSELVSGKSLVTYGEDEVRHHLKEGAVDTLLISEALRRNRVLARCQGCGYELRETVEDLGSYKRRLPERTCSKCGENRLALVQSEDVVQELCNLADQTGASVEFISRETEEGEQLWAAFKGLAAILRYQLA
ncbi:MAG: peptide chain release factor aRF-1 [Candidatus Hadarchaeota archaeon]|nr:peptide chain release factor aRF-1 [Candidatus Hadarchaeota archaeon]